jgi:hypothetical protein
MKLLTCDHKEDHFYGKRRYCRHRFPSFLSLFLEAKRCSFRLLALGDGPDGVDAGLLELAKVVWIPEKRGNERETKKRDNESMSPQASDAAYDERDALGTHMPTSPKTSVPVPQRLRSAGEVTAPVLESLRMSQRASRTWAAIKRM